MADFNVESFPLLKRSCFAENGDLNSFRIVMRGYDEASNKISDSAGPSEYGSCENKSVPT